MTPDDVVFILEALGGADVESIVAGGWGVDALCRTESRDHRDLDIFVDFADLLTAARVLTDHGFRPAEDWLPTRVQFEDGRGRAVDVHPLRLHEGGADLTLLDGTVYTFTPEALAAVGAIGSREVRCLSATQQLRAHVGYEPTDRDRHDVALLCAEFDLEPPEGYAG